LRENIQEQLILIRKKTGSPVLHYYITASMTTQQRQSRSRY